MKPPKPPAPRTWSYGRAFILTSGLAVLGLMFVVWIAQGHKSKEWPPYAWFLFCAMILTGFLICCFSLGSSNKTIKKWFDSSGIHGGEIVIAIVAAPVYWIGRLFEKPRRRR
jgi:hypothetical protein